MAVHTQFRAAASLTFEIPVIAKCMSVAKPSWALDLFRVADSWPVRTFTRHKMKVPQEIPWQKHAWAIGIAFNTAARAMLGASE